MPRLAARPAAAGPSRAYAPPRSAEKDQDQRVEIAGFRFRKAANSSNAVRRGAESRVNREFFAIQQGILFVRNWPGRRRIGSGFGHRPERPRQALRREK